MGEPALARLCGLRRKCASDPAAGLRRELRRCSWATGGLLGAQVYAGALMGCRGPPPKPAPLRVLEGRRAHRPIPVEVPATPGPVDPPEHLAEPSRTVWLALAPELEAKGLLAPRYLPSFEILCDALVHYREAQRLLAATGPLVAGRDGGVVTNPASREFQRYATIVRAYGSDFGLSPAAVTAIARGTPDQSEQRSPARSLG